MSDDGLSINKIAIHRVPGIGHEHGFTIDKLSSGINVIFGPNGSGKSTTARCLQGVLWPGSTGMERPSFAGEFLLDGSTWNIGLEAGHPRVLRDGEHDDPPQIGPAEIRHRYHLALDELLQKETDPEGFAKTIAEESRGGYDLEGAANALGFREKPKSPRTERKALDEAKAARQEARQRNEQLQHSARELDDIKKEYQQAQGAERRLADIESAIEYHETESRRQELQARLDQYPVAMSKLHGDERETLDRLSSEQSQYEEEKTAEETARREAADTIEKANLSGDGVESVVLEELKTHHSDLYQVESDIRNQRQSLAEAQAKVDTAAGQIGANAKGLQEGTIQEVPIPELDDFLPEVERVRAQEAVLEEKDRWLATETAENVAAVGSQQLRDGISALSRWLATPPQGPRNVRQIYWAFMVSSALAVALCVVLGFIHAALGWWIGGGALLVVWAALAWKHRNALYEAPESRDRDAHRKTYEDTGLERPEEWQNHGVSSRIRELTELLATRTLEDEREGRREQLSQDEEALERDRQKLEKRRRAVEDELGIDLQIDDRWFSQLATRIRRWLSAREDVSRTDATLADLKERRNGHLSAINERLNPFDYAEVDSAAAAGAAIQDLEERNRTYRQAVNARHDADQRLRDRIQPSLERIQAQRAAIFDRLGIEPSEEYKIDEWLVEYDEFSSLERELSDAAAIAQNKKESLEGKERLIEADLVELQQERTEAEAEAGKTDQLHEQIIRIEQEIERAKKGHDLADRLAEEEEARSELRNARDENRRALVGHSIAEWVRTEAIESTRPRVFVRASEILQKFTNHTLGLEIDDTTSSSEFRARRLDGTVSPLGELSGGERLQVLIAVRMAFVEQDERAKLPLLLDETLGTSDDTRAGVIIDSIIDLAREGRQVFYFTAQNDEVGKWKEKLEGADVDSRPFDLADIRRESVAEVTPLVIREVDRPSPPDPGKQNYKAYGETLNVPGLDPMHTTTDEVHVWHLFQNTDDLYRILKMGISQWGQLRNAQEVGHSSVIDQELYERAAAAAKAIDAAFAAFRVGRGRPVDRAVLDESGAVSGNFIDEVSELAKKLDGKGDRLIEALEGGHVNRWRQDKTEELRTYFMENGYLSTEEPLGQDDIRVRVVASVDEELEEGVIDEALIDRIVGALPE